MISTIKYDNKNFPIPSDRVFERLLDLDEALTGQPVKISSIFADDDKTPSMTIFLAEEGFYRFKDFSTGLYGDVADIASFLFDIKDRQKAFRKILEIFKDEEYKPDKKRVYSKPASEVTSHKKRKWNVQDELYWKDYYLGGFFLKKYNIKPLLEYTMTISKLGVTQKMLFKNPMSYGFYNAKGELCKVYNPKQKKGKFLKVREFIQGEDQLTYKTKILIIGSSLKDIGAFETMKFKEIELVAPDSENVDIPKDRIDYYKTKYKYIFSMFDNDTAGMTAMKKYKDTYKIPYIYFTVENDMAECVKEHGPKNSKIFLTPVLKDAIRRENIRLNTKQ
jgi:hypothetical protein